MCTVSWLLENDGYRLFANRDERRDRPVALPPRIVAESSLAIVSPTDPVGGGTWIAANSLGIAVAVLNGNATPHAQASRSRGLLPYHLVRTEGWDCLLERLDQIDLSEFLPFTLVLIAPGQPIEFMQWDGWRAERKTTTEPHGMIASSSLDLQGVASYRRSLFQSLLPADGRVTADWLEAFHCYHGDGPSAYTPCMHRADAATVSYSRLDVSASEITFRYSPEPPCAAAPLTRLTLSRSS